MHAYLINLPEAKDRLAACKKELVTQDISFTIVEAIHGKRLTYPHKNFSDFGYHVRQGRRRIDSEVGCYLSHLKAIQCFLDSDQEYGLILEDDISFCPGFTEIIKRAITTIPFDILRLSTVNSGRWSKTIHLQQNYYAGVAFTREKGAGAYVINRKAALRMVQRYLPMKLPYDHRFDLEWLDGLLTYGVSPSPVTQRGFETQIQQNIRSYYFPAWKRYWTVFPFRACYELSRVVFRSFAFLKLKFHRIEP